MNCNSLGMRGVIGAALAMPLAMLLVGAGGGLIFDPAEPLRLLGTPTWILVAYGFFELGLAGLLWIPYLHRLAGLLVALDAVARAGVNLSAGRAGWAWMHLIVGLMGFGIAVLWTSRGVDPHPVRTATARRAAA